jgi:hypothetical protein
MLDRQRAFLHERIKTRAKSHVVYPGLTCFKDGKRVKDIMAVPGVREAGWNLAQLGPVSQVGRSVGRSTGRRWMDGWMDVMDLMDLCAGLACLVLSLWLLKEGNPMRGL